MSCPAVESYARLSEHDCPASRPAAAAPTGIQDFAAERESPAELGTRPISAAGPPSANHPNLQEPQRPTFKPGSRSVTPWMTSDLTATRYIQPSTLTSQHGSLRWRNSPHPSSRFGRQQQTPGALDG
jgi:hypothetical protein